MKYIFFFPPLQNQLTKVVSEMRNPAVKVRQFSKQAANTGVLMAI